MSKVSRRLKEFVRLEKLSMAGTFPMAHQGEGLVFTSKHNGERA